MCIAGRSRVEGGDRGWKLKVFWAKSFSWTAETQRPQVVDGGGTLPPRKEMKESEDGRRGGNLHLLFGISARARQDALPQAREGEREETEAPPARTYVRNRHV